MTKRTFLCGKSQETPLLAVGRNGKRGFGNSSPRADTVRTGFFPWKKPRCLRRGSLPLAARCLLFVALALAVLPAAWPYFGDGLPRTNDVAPHLYRTLALDRLVQEGRLWPRWSPDLVHGYGYPVFNYFPSLSHYLVELYYLVGLPLTVAYRVAILSHFVLAAWFAYLLACDLYGPVGGWGAALAYVYSPYFLYDVHVRGSLPETQALALLPLLLWALWRSVRCEGRWLAVSGLIFAALILSHPGIIFQSSILIGLLVIWLSWREGWPYLWRPVSGLILGAVIASFFWLSVFTDLQYVQTDLAILRGLDYRNYFLILRDLFSWPRLPVDPALVNPPVVRSLPQVALALSVLLLIWRWRRLSRTVRNQVGLWLGLLVIAVFFIMPISRPLWNNLPLLKLTLMPFRFLGMASLAAALLLAASLAGLRVQTRILGLLAVITLSLLIGGLPWLYPPREPFPESPGIADLVAFEQPPLFIGTTTLGEYLPVWVKELPDTTELRDRLASGQSPDRLLFPEQVTVQRQGGSVLDAVYHISADVPATLTYRQFYFPGWRVTLDDQSLRCSPGTPNGLLQFDVPAGEHVLRVTFGSTLPRRLGWILSGLGALTFILLLLFPPGRFEAASSPGALKGLPACWLAALVSLLLGGKLFFDIVDTPLRRPALGPDGLHGIQHAQPVDFAGELRLLGYDQSADYIVADEEIALDLYWTPLRPIGVAYDVAVHVVGQDGLVWNREEAIRPSDWRFAPGADSWPLDGYVMDSRLLRLLDGAPPGEYAFRIGLVRRDTGQTVALHRVGHLTIASPARGESALEEGMQPAPERQPWDGLRLMGSRTDRSRAAPGEQVRLTLLWQVPDPPTSAVDGRLTLALVTPEDQTVFTAATSVARHYPPARWQPGERLRTEALLRLPAHTPAGEHSWQVRVDQAGSLPIGALRVRTLERRWTVPPLDAPVDVCLGGMATLLGVNLQSLRVRSSETISVTLVWQAETEMMTSYRVFLHLIDPDGNLVTQSDSEPVNWMRPTTGWLPGEVLLDERILKIPDGAQEGDYTLLGGLYDQATGKRLIAPDSSDTVSLAIISVQSQ